MVAFLNSCVIPLSLNQPRRCSSPNVSRPPPQASSLFATGDVRFKPRNERLVASRAAPKVAMLIDPWSVSQQTLDVLAAQFFAVSLIPYLGFLYFLERPQNETPPLAAFGFRFLLVFVFATIPAGIYAKIHYHDILANVDWLHGSAESLLTITNLLVAVGMRNAMRSTEVATAQSQSSSSSKLRTPTLATATATALSLASMGFALSANIEPGNALSFPTWVIHVSSLIEWLVAMGLVWQYSDYTANPRWKGLTWGMLPLHTSGICACTYHLFYNAPSLNLLVTLQAALTCFGNATMALAAYRISKYDADMELPASGSTSETPASNEANAGLIGFEDLAGELLSDTNVIFVGKLIFLSAIGSAIVKYGELYTDFVFQARPSVALAIILVPTFLNMTKWGVRSKSPDSEFGKFL